MAKKKEPLRPGAYWLELDTGRRIRILDPFVRGIGPSWTYVDSLGLPVPESEAHPNRYEHYCDIFDFTVWNRFLCEDSMLILGTRPADACSEDDDFPDPGILDLDEFELFSGISRTVSLCLSIYPNGWRPFTLADWMVRWPDDGPELLVELGYLAGSMGTYLVQEKLVQLLIELRSIRYPLMSEMEDRFE